VKPSGFEPDSYDWSDPSYDDLRGIRDPSFAQKIFNAKPALVSRLPRDGYIYEVEYVGQDYDPAE
jgi:hypothetical protein